MSDTTRDPVADWATDFDHTHPDYAANAPEIWASLRESCPVAHTDRFGGAWMPTRHDDVAAIAHDTEHFTSQAVIISDYRPIAPRPIGYAPPISSDPPFHAPAKRVLLPPFAPKAIANLEDRTRSTCRNLLDDLLDGTAEGDVVDAAIGYSQHIPVRIIAYMLGIPEQDGDKFREFIRRIIELPGQIKPNGYEDTLDYYLSQAIDQRRADPGDDLISYLLEADLDGTPLSDQHVLGSVALLLIAGIDTTWSAIGASLWHMAQNPQDRNRWIEDPEVRPFAVEEFLRFYAPVTMARIVAEDVEVGGCPMKPGDWSLLPFPAANRDPEMFDRADEFIIDRRQNRHATFGLGIHRCIGSNLARMELRVALEEWMERVPEFSLADPERVRWATGQIRGPRELPMVIGS